MSACGVRPIAVTLGPRAPSSWPGRTCTPNRHGEGPDPAVLPQVKCEHYWPLDAQPCTHGHLQVTLEGEKVMENWTVRDLKLRHVSLPPPHTHTPSTSIPPPGRSGKSPPHTSQGPQGAPGMPPPAQSAAKPLSPVLSSPSPTCLGLDAGAEDSVGATVPLRGLARPRRPPLPGPLAGLLEGAQAVAGQDPQGRPPHRALQVRTSPTLSSGLPDPDVLSGEMPPGNSQHGVIWVQGNLWRRETAMKTEVREAARERGSR